MSAYLAAWFADHLLAVVVSLSPIVAVIVLLAWDAWRSRRRG